MRIENGTTFVKFTTWQCVDTFDELDLQLHLLLDKETQLCSKLIRLREGITSIYAPLKDHIFHFIMKEDLAPKSRIAIYIFTDFGEV